MKFPQKLWYYVYFLIPVFLLLSSLAVIADEAEDAYRELRVWIEANQPTLEKDPSPEAKARYAKEREIYKSDLKNKYKEFINLYPNSPCSEKIYFQLGKILFSESSYRELITLYESFLGKFPRSVYRNAVARDLFLSMIKLGDLKKAKSRLTEWLNENPEQPEILMIQQMIETIENLKIGGQVPEIQEVSVSGDKISLRALKGQVVLVEFWATWCGPCRWQIPWIKKIYDKYKDQGFIVIGISLDYKKENLEKFLSQEKIPWPQIHDHDKSIVSLWGINEIPHLYLIDRQGIIQAIDIEREELEEMVGRFVKK